MTKYSYFFHKLRKKFDMKKTELCYKGASPKGTKENVNLVTLDKRSLLSPPAAEVLVFGEETLSSLHGSL